MLFERGDALSVIDTLFAAAAGGSGQVALISATAGFGKTTLLRAFLNRTDAVSLTATGSAAERTVRWGVLAQLLDNPSVELEYDSHIKPLLSGRQAEDHDGPLPADAHVTHPVCHMLVRLSRHSPIVLSVDDVQHIDKSSLGFLVHLIARAHTARILVLLTERPESGESYLPLYSELLRQPHYVRVRLNGLSVNGVREVVSATLGPAAAQELATELHIASGGNPLLVRALIEDYQANGGRAAGQARPRLIAGDAFAQAVLGCLYSSEPTVLQVATGLAVLGESASTTMLGRLLGIESETIAQIVQTLTATGILTEGKFRHPAASAAILNVMSTKDRLALNWDAASLLFDAGAAATVVAHDLMASDPVALPWVVGVLIEAADQALLDEEVTLAKSFLEMAYRCSTDEARSRPTDQGAGRRHSEQLSIKLALAAIELRLSPSAGVRFLDQLTAELRQGKLAGRESFTLCQLLLQHGQPEEVEYALGRRDQLTDPNDPSADLEWRLIRARLNNCMRPPRSGSAAPPTSPASKDPIWATVALNRRLKAVNALDAVLTRGPDETAVIQSEQVLEGSQLTAATFSDLVDVVTTLIYAGELDKARTWTDRLIEDASAMRAANWHGVFSSLRATVAGRQGDLCTAESHARAALTRVPASAWGVGIGLPLSVLLLVAAETGDHDDAASLLSQPVPDTMFRTRFGLHYLHARGHYYLAADRPHAALGDFMTCGELMTEWGIDQPSILAWRTSAAQAWLRLGEHTKAADLVTDQLSRLGPQDSGPVRGSSLRILAVAGDMELRPPLLREAIETLQDAGDELELAKALADLSVAQQSLGEVARARMTVRRALHLARKSHAKTLSQSLLGTESSTGATRPSLTTDDEDTLTWLTEAERRVAALASEGDTNRQIADELHVTVSTVEQHLTRVYRKLNIKRRQDLPIALNRAIVYRQVRNDR